MVFVQRRAISRKLVRLEILANAAVRTELVQDLGRMGCAGLYYVTWDIEDVGIVEDAFFGRTPSHFNGNPVRGKPDFWKESCWRMAWGFPKSETVYIKVRNDPIVGVRFYNPTHEHDESWVEHCINSRNAPA